MITTKNVEELATKNGQVLSYKVSTRGAVSVYGLGHFPVTLYKSPWEKLFQHPAELKQFSQDNEASLKVKKS